LPVASAVPGLPSAEQLSALPAAGLAVRLAGAYRLIAELTGQVERLTALNERLSARVDELERRARQDSSHPDESYDCPPAACRRCGAGLAGEPVTASRRHQVTDIGPPPWEDEPHSRVVDLLSFDSELEHTLVRAGCAIITNRRYDGRLNAANLVYEQAGDRFAWQLDRFRTPTVPPSDYHYGPYGRTHGLGWKDFFDSRRQTPGIPVWSETVAPAHRRHRPGTVPGGC
jgi:hypothetical protein